MACCAGVGANAGGTNAGTTFYWRCRRFVLFHALGLVLVLAVGGYAGIGGKLARLLDSWMGRLLVLGVGIL